MDVYHFVIFLERSRRNDFGQGRRDEEGGLLPFSPFILFPFYSFTLLPFYSFTFLRISKLQRGRCCDQACIDGLFVLPLLMCRF